MHRKIEKTIQNCVQCIMMNRKSGKQEGFLNPIPKEDTPLHTYHVDHLGPLESTHKSYNHILTVIDAFTKFVSLYPTKSTTSKEVIDRLDLQKKIFGNPCRMIADRVSAFRSEEFQNYCKTEDIQLHWITTGMPRCNGQVERINRTITPILFKLSADDPTNWYRHISRLQQVLNSNFNRSLGRSPFENMFGVKMRKREDIELKEHLDEAMMCDFENRRTSLRLAAKQQIQEVQQENKRHYDLRRKAPIQYSTGQLVAIKRTQQGPGQKLRPNFLGPYRIE